MTLALALACGLLTQGCFPVLLLGAFVTGPFMDSGEGPNRCYVLRADLAQTGPCKPVETRGMRR